MFMCTNEEMEKLVSRSFPKECEGSPKEAEKRDGHRLRHGGIELHSIPP